MSAPDPVGQVDAFAVPRFAGLRTFARLPRAEDAERLDVAVLGAPFEACRATIRGEPFIYPGAVKALVRDYLTRAAEGEELPDDPLTERESEIVKLIAEGHMSKQIAEML